MGNLSFQEESLRQVETLIRRGLLEDAESLCRELLRLAPNTSDAWAYLGIIALQSKRIQDAEGAFRAAVDLNSSDSGSWHHLSIALHEQGRSSEAEECSRKALSLSGSEAPFWLQLGNVLFKQERFVDASQAFRQSLVYDPRNATTWNNLGAAEHVQDHPEAARQAYEASLALAPLQPETRLKLALLFEKQWSLCEAKAMAQQALATEPERADAWAMLGRVNFKLGEYEEAVSGLSRSSAIQPSPAAHSWILQCSQYAENVTPQSLLTAHREWNDAFATILVPPAQASRSWKNSGRPLSIGFVSGEFGFNPVGYLVLPAIQNLDTTKCKVTCYFDCRTEDAMTPRFRDAAASWRVTFGLTTEQFVAQVRQDEIDVLVDLMGHMGNRLVAFANKPAPVQITWLGYVGTTGLQAMDFLLADRFHVGPGEESFYTETVLRMPNGYVCYGPPMEARDVEPLPALANGYVTFGCFNNPAKYSPSMLRTWAEILRRVPSARLLLKFGGLHQPETQERLLSKFAEQGLEQQRILFEGWSPHAALLASYRRVDLALDTQPYSGGLTTCEALWMGVPVITLPGKTFAGRHATSHLTNAGYAQFVAENESDYIELAVRWAGRLESLRALRAEMREQVQQSSLCNAPRFAADFLRVVSQAYESRVAVER